MPVRNPRDLFAIMLSDVRQNAERMTTVLREISQIAEDPQVTDALEESEFVARQDLARLDHCFKLIGERPVKPRGRVRDVLAQEILKEASEITSPIARQLFVLSKAIQLIHLDVGEYIALIAAADIAGNHTVKELLESCLGDKLVAVERARCLIRSIIELRIRVLSVA